MLKILIEAEKLGKKAEKTIQRRKKAIENKRKAVKRTENRRAIRLVPFHPKRTGGLFVVA